jgi:hypothetical protein
VDKVALGRVLFEYFGFSCQSSFHQILHHHNHSGQATIGQSVAVVPSGPSWTQTPTKLIKKKLTLMLKNFPILYACESSLPCSQQPSTGPYPEPEPSSPQHPMLSISDPFEYYPATYVWVFPVVSFLLVFLLKSYASSSSPPCILHVLQILSSLTYRTGYI